MGFMKKKIMIIDDEKLILFSLSAALAAADCEIVSVGNGSSALDQATASPDYDIFIVDLTLPDIRGIDLIIKLRQVSPASSFIIMSGKFPDRQTLLAEVGDDFSFCQFIPKPFDFAEARLIVGNLLEEDQ